MSNAYEEAMNLNALALPNGVEKALELSITTDVETALGLAREIPHWKINTEEESRLAADALGRVKKALKELDASRKMLTAGADRLILRARGWIAPKKGALELAERQLKSLIGRYNEERETAARAARLESERRARAAAAQATSDALVLGTEPPPPARSVTGRPDTVIRGGESKAYTTTSYHALVDWKDVDVAWLIEVGALTLKESVLVDLWRRRRDANELDANDPERLAPGVTIRKSTGIASSNAPGRAPLPSLGRIG